MSYNLFKRAALIIILTLILFSVVVSVSAGSDDNESKMLSLSKDGITIDYPSDWGYSQASSEYSIMAISKLDAIDSSGRGQININVEKKSLDTDLESYLNSTYGELQKDSAFQLISYGDLDIGGQTAHEFVYNSDVNGIAKQHKAVWFEKDGQAVVLLYSAPKDDFEGNLYVFDYLLSNIKIS